jgi:hypothetical protein
MVTAVSLTLLYRNSKPYSKGCEPCTRGLGELFDEKNHKSCQGPFKNIPTSGTGTESNLDS